MALEVPILTLEKCVGNTMRIELKFINYAELH